MADKDENQNLAVIPVSNKAHLKQFVELAYRLNASDPNWVPPLRSEVYALLNPAKNPFFEHATVQLFLAVEKGEVVGRISAHIDHLALEQPAEQGMDREPETGDFSTLRTNPSPRN